jgi:hypothetical protein
MRLINSHSGSAAGGWFGGGGGVFPAGRVLAFWAVQVRGGASESLSERRAGSAIAWRAATGNSNGETGLPAAGEVGASCCLQHHSRVVLLLVVERCAIMDAIASARSTKHEERRTKNDWQGTC